MLLDFAGSVQHVDPVGKMRPGFHFVGTFDTSSLASMTQSQPGRMGPTVSGMSFVESKAILATFRHLASKSLA
jgi:hypothetical protein